MIQEDYVSFETAKLLKKKGFESDCCHTAYDSNEEFFWHGDYSKDRKGIIDAPTLQMAMKWLRKEHKLFIEIGVSIDLLGNPHFNYSIVNKDGKYFREGYTSFEWEYEKACESAIKYCLENLI